MLNDVALPDYNKNRKKKLQIQVILLGTGGIIGIYLLSSFLIDTYKSLDALGQAHLSEFMAAIIGIVIHIVKKKFKTEQLENFDLLMLVMIAVIAGYALITSLLSPVLIIVFTIIALVVWFVYFGLLNYLGDKKRIEKAEFLNMFLIFIGLTIVIIVGFNIIRVYDLFKSVTI